MIKRTLIPFLTLLFILAVPSMCKYPKPAGWVSDFAGVMDTATVSQLNALLSELESKTSAEVAVVTIPELENESIEDAAVSIIEEWKIGKKGKDNGVLIIASIKPKRVRIEVGYGLEGVITDGTAGEILDTYVIPALKEGNYSKGLAFGAAVVSSIIAKDAGVELTGVSVQRSQKKQKAGPISIFFRIIFFIFMAILFIKNPFLFFLLLSGARGGSGGGFGGGFGGFGGGSSGGGGASRGF